MIIQKNYYKIYAYVFCNEHFVMILNITTYIDKVIDFEPNKQYYNINPDFNTRKEKNFYKSHG